MSNQNDDYYEIDHDKDCGCECECHCERCCCEKRKKV